MNEIVEHQSHPNRPSDDVLDREYTLLHAMKKRLHNADSGSAQASDQ